MSSQAEQTTSQSLAMPQMMHVASQTGTQRTPRLFFIDHIRVALTMLVIVHHLAITYGALCPCWYYQEPTKDSLLAVSLTVFLFVDQSFFMGLFFLLAGYFTPGSYERKGPAAFLRDRLLRLGIPLLIFFVVLNPLVSYIGAGAPISYWEFLLRYAAFIIGPGPLWFVEALLLFDCLYALWRWLSRKQATPVLSANTSPTVRMILLFTLILAVGAFLVRLVFRFGWPVPVLNVIPSNFPQYIGLFIVGVLASRRNWFLNIPGWMGKVGLVAALVSTLTLFPLATLFGGRAFMGGIHWQAFVYALWEAIMAVGMGIGLTVLFRQRLNRQGRWGKFLSAHAYVVYIIHALVIVVLALLLRDVHLYPLLKLALASLIGIPLCFACGYLVRRLPFAHKIL